MGLVRPDDPNRPEMHAFEVQHAPIYVGGVEDFVPGSTFFQLSGERADVWHSLARPADELAKYYLQKNYGRFVSRVMSRPSWAFHDPPHDATIDPQARLIDGLLCGCMIEESGWFFGQGQPRVDEKLSYTVVTKTGFTRLLYLRRVGERVANLILQSPLAPQEYCPKLLRRFKAHCPHWEVYIEE